VSRATDFLTREAALALAIRNRAARGGHWIVFAVVMVVGLAAALVLRRADGHSLVYFGDVASHLAMSRKLVDWGDDPGLGRFGTAWLPVPHLLLLPFTLVTPLFTTGYAGLAVSLPSLALTAALLYKIVRIQLGGAPYLAGACALLYALNPNILYLGLIAMTEAPFMLFFVAAAYLLQKWYRDPDDLRPLALASLAVVLATLCRYEGWVLPVVLVAVAAVRLARVDLPAGRRAAGVLLALGSFTGVVLWMAYNALQFGDPLEFANAEYYSAASQARTRDVRETLFLQPVNVLSVYGVTAFTVYGPLLLAGGLAGLVDVVRRRGRAGPGAETWPLLAFLALPPLFTLALLVVGIGEMAYWFNSRFLILLSPLLLVLTARAVQGLYRRTPHARTVVAAALSAWLVLQGFMILIDRVPVYLDARGGFFWQVNPYAVEAGEALAAVYDGGKIMVTTGSAQEHRIMVTAGIPLGQYDEIIESSRSKPSYDDPWRYDRWMVISRSPDSDGVSATEQWTARHTELHTYYDTVYENRYYEILRREDR
jgi:hypothetical protein